MPYTNYDAATHTSTQLIDALFLNKAGLAVNYDSLQLIYGVTSSYDYATSTTTAVNSLSFYDGSLNLGIGAGLLLTSGYGVIPTSNSQSGYGTSFENFYQEPDADLKNAVDIAFSGAGSITDFTSLSFSFEVTDPSIKSIRFDLVFGSDEYPEYVNSSYVDIAGVFVNGVNYALFNGTASQPLSVLESNLSAGNFINNSDGVRSIEYDGISSKLEIIAPVQLGTNTIKIAIGDTGDSAYDSGLFVANLAAANIDGFGLAEVVTLPGGKTPTDDSLGNQIYKLSDGFSYLNLLGGNDVVEGTDDGVSYINLAYGLADLLGASFANGVLSLQGPTGSAILSNVSKVGLQDILVALDTNQGEATWDAMALLNATLKSVAIPQLLAQWSAAAENATDMNQLAQDFLNYYFPQGLSTEVLVGHLLNTVAGIQGTTEQIQGLADLIGEGKTFANNGEFLAFAAQLELNTNQFADLVGNLVVLDKQVYESAI